MQCKIEAAPAAEAEFNAEGGLPHVENPRVLLISSLPPTSVTILFFCLRWWRRRWPLRCGVTGLRVPFELTPEAVNGDPLYFSAS